MYNLLHIDLLRTYQDLELCLSTSQTCPQIHMMARYFARNYTDYVMKCPLPMPVMKTTTSSEQETEELDPVLTDDTPMPELTDDTTFSKLEGNSKPNQDPIEKTKEMVTKELSTTTVKGKILFFLNSCKFKTTIEV